MKLGARLKTGLNQSVQARIDPKIVLTSQLLQLSSLELEQAIESELMENPALERIEESQEPITHEEILRTIAPEELRETAGSYEGVRSRPTDGDSTDWTDLASSADSLWDHLIGQMHMMLPQHLHRLAEYYVGSVNERGYLTVSIEEAALDCNASLEESQEVFDTLRQCEPMGVGATDLRDCLMLQLRSPHSDAERLARRLVAKEWDDLVSRNIRGIIRKTKAEEELVQAAFDAILALNPFPGEGYEYKQSAGRQAKSVTALPDVRLSLTESGWVIEVPGFSCQSLKISRSYEQRLEVLKGSGHAHLDEKRHISEFVERAQRFMDALGQRRHQLLLIGRYLVEKQAGFVKTGDYKFLSSLTRSQMAKDLGVHESTISRATNGKFLQISTGEVVSFDVLFKPALRIQKMIEEILAHENPDSPLSDERIAQMLEAKGVKVARRTVNKYRDRRKLLSSRHRRMA